jgi:hypothetical protein
MFSRLAAWRWQKHLTVAVDVAIFIQVWNGLLP